MDSDPYRPPAAEASEFTAASGATKSYQKQGLGTLRTVCTIAIFVLCGLFCLISVGETIGSVMFPGFSDPQSQVSSDAEMMLAIGITLCAVLTIIVQIVSAVALCRFMYRANANLRASGVNGLEFTPGWCAGWWFVPVANLYKPFGAMKELYRASRDPHGDWRQTELPSSMGIWWAAWIIGSVVSRFEASFARSGVDAGMFLTWASTILMIVAGVSLVSILKGINWMQDSHGVSGEPGDQFA